MERRGTLLVPPLGLDQRAQAVDVDDHVRFRIVNDDSDLAGYYQDGSFVRRFGEGFVPVSEIASATVDCERKVGHLVILRVSIAG